MKTFFVIGSIGSALFLGWQHQEMSEKKAAAESRASALAAEIAEKNQAAEAAEAARENAAQIAASPVPAMPVPPPAPKENWVLEQNRNWQGVMSRGAYDQHSGVASPPSIVIVDRPYSSVRVPRFVPPPPRPPLRPPPIPAREMGASSGHQPPPVRPMPPHPRPPGSSPPGGS